MKPMDIMESLTDMDDDILLRAELTPAAKRHGIFRHLRMATAAPARPNGILLHMTTAIRISHPEYRPRKRLRA